MIQWVSKLHLTDIIKIPCLWHYNDSVKFKIYVMVKKQVTAK